MDRDGARRRLIVLGAVVAVAVTLVWLGVGGGRGQPNAKGGGPTTATTTTIPERSDARNGITVSNWTPLRWLGALALPTRNVSGARDSEGPRDGESPWDEALIRLNDPSQSDLGAGDGAEASRVAAAVLRADITGAGRGAYPAYFGLEPATRTCPDFSVLGSGADKLPSNGPGTFAVALVIWSGSCPESSGRPVTSRIYLQRIGAAWQPVQPTSIS